MNWLKESLKSVSLLMVTIIRVQHSHFSTYSPVIHRNGIGRAVGLARDILLSVVKQN